MNFHLASFVLLAGLLAAHATVTERVFLDDITFAEAEARLSRISLGAFPHQCLGNVTLCPNGFTIAAWYKPQPRNRRVAHRYIISTGGQSEQSNGIYLRQNYGMEHELGVGIGARLWRASFHLPVSSWTHVAMTFSQSTGLKVYVDGQAVAANAVGSQRFYVEVEFDQFADLVVGQSNDLPLDQTAPGVAVWKLTHADAVYSKADFVALSADPPGALLLGCSATKPTLPASAVHVTDAAALSDVTTCRSDCFLRRLNIVVFRSSQECVCVDWPAWSAASHASMSSTCSGNELYTVTWSTHAIFDPVAVPLQLTVKVVRPTSHDYIRPSETVSFELSTTTPEAVVYLVNFDDARSPETLTTTDGTVAHAWSSAGNYSVNVTAITRTTHAVKIVPVQILDLEEGVPPENLDIKADVDRRDPATDHQVMSFLQAYSPRQKRCTVDYGDESDSEVFDELTDPIFSVSQTHQYPGLGFYAVSLACDNKFGTSSESAVAVAAQPGLRYQNVVKGIDLVIPVAGADGSVGSVVVYVDGATVTSGVRINNTHVSISKSLLATTGEHAVTLKTAGGLTFSSKIVNVETPVSGVLLNPSKEATLMNRSVEFVVSVMTGDNMFVNLSYGDGHVEIVYVQSSPVTLTRRHSYMSLGKFAARLAVANALGVHEVVRVVSVERPINRVSMKVTSVKLLGQPTTFTFTVDPTLTPAMPVTVRLDYDDGNEETVTLGAMKPVATALTHTYTYAKYGMYHVKATVVNNVSSVTFPPTLIQVGDNVTSVDVSVADWLVPVDAPVGLTVACPRGWPIMLTVDMGDGQPPQRVARPADYDPATDDRVYPRRGQPAPTTSSRRRRDAEETAIIGQPFKLTYQYRAPGNYKVKVSVSNGMSNTSSWLCPSIVVINPPAASAPVCKPTASIVNTTTLNNPLTSLRSAAVTIKATSQLQCTSNGASATPLYTWTLERLMANGQWRPELAVCTGSSSSPDLVVPGNTLWYAKYRVNVTVSVSDGSNTAALERSAPATTYLWVQPSPLVSSLVPSKTDFQTSDMVNLNMTDSRDPDVIATNTSGIRLGVFCYPASASDVYEKLNADQLRTTAESIANNSAGTAGIYQFSANPCFKTTTNVWVMGLEVVFPAANLTGNDSLVFTAFMTKDSRVAQSSATVRVWAMALDASALDSIDDLLAKGDTNAALLVINMVTNGLNGDGSQNGSAVEERSNLRGKLIGALDKVSGNLQNMDQITKTTDVMSSVTSNPDEVKSTDKANAAGAIGKTASAAKGLATDASEDQVVGVTGSIMSSLGNILPFDKKSSSRSVSDNRDAVTTTAAPRVRRSAEATENSFEFSGNDTSLSNETTCCSNISGLCDWIEPVGWLCVDEDDRKFAVWTEEDCLLIHPDDIRIYEKRYNAWLNSEEQAANALKKKTTTSGMGAFGDIGGVLMDKQQDGKARSVSSPSINMTVMKVDQSGSGLNMDGYSLPADALSGVGSGGGFMMVKSPNAYTYSNGSSGGVSGNVMTLTLNGAGGSPMSVSHTDKPFELWMEGADEEPELSNFTFLSNTAGDAFNYHPVAIADNGSALFATIIPVSPADVYYVYLKYEGFPNETFYDWISIIPNPELDETDPKRYVFAPPQNYTSINGTYRIGIRLKAAQIHVEKIDSASNYTYGIYFTTAACRFWNDTSDTWDTAGCKVGPLTTYAKTQCLCTHLTSFGGDVYVPPNTIDFNTVFTAEKFLESMPVFSTVAGMIGIYVLIIVWARHMDKKDVSRWGAVPLEDNVPSDSYYYQLAVYTGVRKGAGTKSKPSFIVSGDYADTGVRRLFDGKRKELTTGSIMNFIMSSEGCLGPLTFLRIWHDNSGHGKMKGWFLDQIQITDLQTGEKFFFVCDRWMAVEEDDGMVERILPVAGTNDLTQFKQLFNKSVRKKMTNDHLWVSVFSRPTRSHFTRVQRISCCVALLFLTMITNCMFFKAQDPDHATEVHIGPITLTLQQLYISVISTLIVFPPSLTIVTIFRKARPKSNTVDDSTAPGASKRWKSLGAGGSSMWDNGQRSRFDKMRDAIRNITTFHQRSKYAEEDDEEQTGGLKKKKKKKPFSVPHWTIYIAWILVFLSVTLSGFFTVLYSMQWGHTKSVDWLTTFLLSILQSIVFVQPVKVLLLAMFLSCILKKPDNDDEDLSEEDNHLKHDEEFLSRSERDIQEILKQRRAAQTAIDRPNTEALKKAREVRLKQIEMNAIIKECVIYLIFVLVVYFISYQERDRRSFLFAQNVKNQFFGGKPAFSSIQTREDVYTWVNETLMPSLYSSDWYNGQPLRTWREVLQTKDRSTIRLGIARLRQMRIKDDTCSVASRMSSLIHHCRDDYNWMDDDAKSYSPRWTPLNQTNMTDQCIEAQDKYDIWKYRNSLELMGSPYVGAVNTYKGGGYTFNFRRDPRVTSAKLDELAALDWLDVRTRAVFVEFTLYNANVNLYGSVIMLIEFLSTGAPIIMQEVKVFRLTSYIGPFGVIVIMFQLIFVGFIIYFLVHVVNKIRKEKRKYFRFWNILELCTVILAVLTCAMYGAKILFGNTAMDVLRESGSGSYVNFVTIGVWDEMYGFIMALVVFLSTLKFINMLKFNRRMGMLTDTIKLAAKDMKAFVITFFIYFFAFAQLAYLLFGSVLPSYSSFVNTVESLFALALGDFDFHAINVAQPVLGPLFFFLFIAIIFIGMQTMFLAIICEAFTIVRGNLEYQRNDYEIVDYVMNKFKGLFGMGRRNNESTQQEALSNAAAADDASAPQ